MHCSKQTRWHEADDGRFNAAIEMIFEQLQLLLMWKLFDKEGCKKEALNMKTTSRTTTNGAIP